MARNKQYHNHQIQVVLSIMKYCIIYIIMKRIPYAKTMHKTPWNMPLAVVIGILIQRGYITQKRQWDKPFVTKLSMVL